MATAPLLEKTREIEYPTSDGRPMAETDLHRNLMVDQIEMLQAWFAYDPMVYVSGNLLVYYEEGNKHRHISPDVFVVKGVHNHPRNYYLVWEEKPLDLAIELTSKTTQKEDEGEKKMLYRDVLQVKEYFMFDPRIEYMMKPLQGFRRDQGDYVPIEPIAGRLPSEVLGLHLERSGQHLKLWNPATAMWLPTSKESAALQAEALDRKEKQLRSEQEARQREEQAKIRAQQERAKANQDRINAEQDRAKADQDRIKAEQERTKADQARIKAEQERTKAEQDRDKELEARRRAEEEIAQLRAQLKKQHESGPPPSLPPNAP